MEKKIASGILLILLSVSAVTSIFHIQPVKASGSIYIRADGSVDPPTASIRREGDLYTLTENIYDAIVVERDNIVVDGAGNTVQGMRLSSRTGVTVRNVTFRDCSRGIFLENSSNNIILENTFIHSAMEGMRVWNGSCNNIIKGNTFGSYLLGLELWLNCFDNIISGNNFRTWYYDVIISSDYNTFTGNNHTRTYTVAYWLAVAYGNTISLNSMNKCLLMLERCSNNHFYHNNFTNMYAVSVIDDSANIWDDGYPSGGNYWGDFGGTDFLSGPSQDQPGSDGIVDMPYVIDENNQDNYPLMNPWTEPVEPVDWDGIEERARKRKELYEEYYRMFSPTWWEAEAKGIVDPLPLPVDPYELLESTAEDLLLLLEEALVAGLTVPPVVSAMIVGYDATAALLAFVQILGKMQYMIIAEVLDEACDTQFRGGYDVPLDLTNLELTADSVRAAAEAHDSEALMDALEQEKEMIEDLYQGTVKFERIIWSELTDEDFPPPDVPFFGTYMFEHIYALLVRYPYYWALGEDEFGTPNFDLEICDGQLISLRSQLEANYLDVTNSLGDLTYLDEAVDAPLTIRHVAPLVQEGYWTINSNEVESVDADTEVIANVLLTTYDSMKVNGEVTVEVWKDFNYDDEIHKAGEPEHISLEPDTTRVVLVSFIAEYAQPPIGSPPGIPQRYFLGYYLKVWFSGDGIRNNRDIQNSIENVLVTWKDPEGTEMEDSYPPRLRVRPPKLIIRAESPVNLLVTTPGGLRVGYNPDTDSAINELFEWAAYSGLGTEPQIIFILNPIRGAYTFEIFGTDVGVYTATVEFVAADGSISYSKFHSGETVRGAAYVYSICVGDETITTIPDPVAELEHLKEFIYGLPDNSFDKPTLARQRKNALLNKLDEVTLKVEAGNYTDAINKLFHDIRAKMDGDSTAEDWIVDAETRSSLGIIIDHIISSIETLQQE